MGRHTLATIEDKFRALDRKEVRLKVFYSGEPVRNVLVDVPVDELGIDVTQMKRHRFSGSIRSKGARKRVPHDATIAHDANTWTSGRRPSRDSATPEVALSKQGINGGVLFTEISNRSDKVKRLVHEAVTHRTGAFREQIFQSFKDQKQRETTTTTPFIYRRESQEVDVIQDAVDYPTPVSPDVEDDEVFPEWPAFMNSAPPREWVAQRQAALRNANQNIPATLPEDEIDGYFHKIVPRTRKMSKDDELDAEEDAVRTRLESQARRSLKLDGSQAPQEPRKTFASPRTPVTPTGRSGRVGIIDDVATSQTPTTFAPKPPQGFVSNFKNPNIAKNVKNPHLAPKKKEVIEQNSATRKQYSTRVQSAVYLQDGRKRKDGFNTTPICRPRPASASSSRVSSRDGQKEAKGNALAFVHQKPYYHLHIKVLHSNPAICEWKFDVTVTDVTFPDCSASTTFKGLRVNSHHYIVFQEPEVCVFSPVDLLDWVGEPADLYKHTLRIEVVGVKPFTKVVDTLVYYGEDKPEKDDPNAGGTAGSTMNSSNPFVS